MQQDEVPLTAEEAYGPPTIKPEQFRRRVLQKYGADYDEAVESPLRQAIGKAVDDVWPVGLVDGEPVYRPTHPESVGTSSGSSAGPSQNSENSGGDVPPSYREHQRDAVIDILYSLYVEGNEAVVLSAPTGAGKSLIIYSVSKTLNEVAGLRTFSTTPLNVLIDQLNDDAFLQDITTIKGRNNYQCVHPEDRGAPVDTAICQRDSNFECKYKKRANIEKGCPYYSRKIVAERSFNCVTNLSMLMANSMLPEEADARLTRRNLLAIDEVQNVDSFALTFIGFVVSEKAIPIDWDEVPWVPSEDTPIEQTIGWLKDEVLPLVQEEVTRIDRKNLKSQPEQERLEKLTRWLTKAQNFIEDVERNPWVKTHEGKSKKRIKFEPIYIGDHIEKYLWDQSEKILLASATVPDSLIEDVGLDDRAIERIEVESTFPPENRPVITTRDVGKMSYSERDKTLPKMADEVARISDEWKGYKGFIHAGSYSVAERLYDRLPRNVRQKTRLQDGDNREKSLEEWKEAPISETGSYRDTGGQMFISVAMSEGISLDDDMCRWQCIVKGQFPHLKDQRVSYRMDDNTGGGAEWDWYMGSMLTDMQQACGRAVRSKNDWAITYILDTSVVHAIKRNHHLLEPWFDEAIDVDPGEKIENAMNEDDNESSLDKIAREHFG